MKRQIVSFGIDATHDLITRLSHLSEARSVSDFDAFVLDPFAQMSVATNRPEFERRQREIRDLINRKSGVVICLLRPERMFGINGFGNVSCYALLEQAALPAVNFLKTRVRDGEGSQWKLNRVGGGVLRGYFGVIQGAFCFQAFLEASVAEVEGLAGKVFAENSVGYPLCVEFDVGPGRLCFVPVPENVPSDRLGAAIKSIVEAHFGGPTEIEVPAWANVVAVPGADANDNLIAELGIKRSGIEAQISKLEAERSDLLSYRSLLFGYGKTVLEPVVRKAFSQLGFDVPEEWRGEWDFELTEPGSGRTAIGEIEGSDGPVDVDKYRQLLDYFQTEVLEGRVHKGILAGNGYRTKDLDAQERENQFTQHALRGAIQNGFCLLPTTELFKAICAVLRVVDKDKDNVKAKVRESILSTVGVWRFAPEFAVPLVAIPATRSSGS
jgi:hypothetical protein